VHLTESLSGYLKEWVQSNRLDLAILFDAEPSPNLRLSTMLVENLCIVGPTDAFPTTDGTVEFRELQRYPLVLPGVPHSLRRLLDIMALSHGIRLNVAYEVDSLIVTKQLVLASGVFSILPEGAVHDEVAALRLCALKIVAPAVSRSVSLAMCALPGRTPACEQIAKLLLDVARELQVSGVWKASAQFT
jgi:LysR family nitrogen assimilation transcriptional regulator